MNALPSNYFKELLTTLTEEGVKYIICGGVAAVLHGVERATMGLDISLSMDRDNLLKFLGAVGELSLVPRAPIPAESLLEPQIMQKLYQFVKSLLICQKALARPVENPLP